MSEEKIKYFADGKTINGLLAGNPIYNLQEVERKLGVKMVARDSWIKIIAADPDRLAKTLGFLEELSKYCQDLPGQVISQSEFEQILAAFHQSREDQLQVFFSERIKVSPKKRDIIPKTDGQLAYLRQIRQKEIVFGVGPAGTGKTYLAMACAVSELLRGQISRIILTRPAREAGENLGFLPGDLVEKITPYLRPLYDALYDMLEFDEAAALMEKNIIEVAPLAFMRGRTLNNSFVILDEAQNTTVEQMLMFLTRLGFNSQSVITGDPTQTDLTKAEKPGLLHAGKVLKDIPEIGFCYFTTGDIVRHSLIEKIIKAYQNG